VSAGTKPRKLLMRNCCNLVGMCIVVNARSGWKLLTFDVDLRELFSYFSAQSTPFQWLDLATSFS